MSNRFRMKIGPAVAISTLLVVGSLYFLNGRQALAEESAGEVSEQCRELAAHPMERSTPDWTGLPMNQIDSATAIATCQLAVNEDLSSAENAFRLGRAFQAADRHEALAWYRKAADQGYAPAQFNVGWIYFNGLGVARDYAEAAVWYRKAAEQEYVLAQSDLGWMYENGRGVARDDAQAVAWYRRAAEQNYASAQSSLGWMYENGRGVARDYAKALAWYRKAADQDHAPAQTNLGRMYDAGHGVARDYAKAVAWYRKAAEQGEPFAHAVLAKFEGELIRERTKAGMTAAGRRSMKAFRPAKLSRF